MAGQRDLVLSASLPQDVVQGATTDKILRRRLHRWLLCIHDSNCRLGSVFPRAPGGDGQMGPIDFVYHASWQALNALARFTF